MRHSDTATVVFSNPSRTVRVYAVRIDFRILPVALSLCRKITKITNNNFNLKIIMKEQKDIELLPNLTTSNEAALSHSNEFDGVRLSPHFKLSEFTKSITAERLGISNKPDYEQVLAMRQLCREVLEPLRQYYGKPIRITSGFRCPELNEAVGGVGNSQHQYGEAADLSVPSEQVARQWFQWIVRNTDFDQLLFEHSRRLKNRWLHISCRWDRSRNRHQSFFNYQAR